MATSVLSMSPPAPPRSVALRIHGRERQIDAAVERALRHAGCVTITGPIGIGKSRVVEEVRRRLGGAGSRGARVTVFDQTPDGTHETTFNTSATIESIAAERGRSWVVASKAALGVRGEHEIALGLLGVPPSRADRRAVTRSAAMSLLADAARIDVDFIADADLSALVEIVAASDGHPLALEQLAGWLRLLSPADLARAVREGGASCVSSQTRSRVGPALRSLDGRQREVLGALAESRAPFDLRAAQAAVRAAARPHLPATLAALVAAGLLIRVGSESALRLIVPAPIRALARTPASAGARRRLTDHYARVSRPLLEATAADRVRVQRVVRAREEIVDAWEDAHARGDAAEIPLAAALGAMAASGDHDGARHADRIARSIAAHPRSRDLARLEVAEGDARWFAGAPRAADARWRSAVRRVRQQEQQEQQQQQQQEQPAVEAFALIRRATLGPELGRMKAAFTLLDRGGRLASRAGDSRLAILAMGIRGYLLRAQGETLGALDAFDRQAHRARQFGDAFYAAQADASAADCHMMLGEHALGRARYARARRMMARVDTIWASTIDGYMGLSAWEAGDTGDAMLFLRRALRGAIGTRFRAVFAAARAGVLAELGEVTRASSAHAAAEDAAGSRAAGDVSAILEAAFLLVAHAGSTDARSRRSTTGRIRRHLAARAAAVGEDERAFLRALVRTQAGQGGKKTAAGFSELPRDRLDSRPRLARVLAVLRGRREPMSAAALFEAAWPNERNASAKTAEARVRKAISLLRDLGLRGSIATRDGGYVLLRSDLSAPVE